MTDYEILKFKLDTLNELLLTAEIEGVNLDAKAKQLAEEYEISYKRTRKLGDMTRQLWADTKDNRIKQASINLTLDALFQEIRQLQTND